MSSWTTDYLEEHCVNLLYFSFVTIFQEDFKKINKIIFFQTEGNSPKYKVILNIKFHAIPCISSRATLATKFLSHTHRQTHKQTDRQTFSRNSQIVFRTSQNV